MEDLFWGKSSKTMANSHESERRLFGDTSALALVCFHDLRCHLVASHWASLYLAREAFSLHLNAHATTPDPSLGVARNDYVST